LILALGISIDLAVQAASVAVAARALIRSSSGMRVVNRAGRPASAATRRQAEWKCASTSPGSSVWPEPSTEVGIDGPAPAGATLFRP
jgi:hypothetical protein